MVRSGFSSVINKSCPWQNTNSTFPTMEKGKGFEVNRATVLVLRATGCGHTAASKCLSFLGLAPISKSCWAAQTKTIEGEAQICLEEELNRGAHNVKERKFSLGAVNCSLEELDNAVVDAGVTIDASVLNNLDSHQHCYGSYLSGYREGRQCRPHQFFFK